MTDPIAEAAKQNAESSLLEKAMETIHTLEEKVEKLVHPEAASEPQSAAGESSTDGAAEPATTEILTSTGTASGTGTTIATSAEVAQPGESSGTVTASSTTTTSETSIDTSAIDTTAATADASSSSSTESTQSAGTDLPNAVTAAVAQPDTQPSAAVASTLSGTVGIVASSADRIRSHLAAIKHHLSIRGFEQSAVADIHAELDAIEGWL